MVNPDLISCFRKSQGPVWFCNRNQPSVPPASYVKAIDVWTAVCQFMVFAAVLQFSYVNYLARMSWKKLKDDTEASEEAMRKIGEIKAKRADLFSKFLFPFTFALFNIAYWTAYSGSRLLINYLENVCICRIN